MKREPSCSDSSAWEKGINRVVEHVQDEVSRTAPAGHQGVHFKVGLGRTTQNVMHVEHEGSFARDLEKEPETGITA